MRLRRFAGVLACAAAPLLTGCFQHSTLVKLNPDGSGTIELTTMVSTTPSDIYDPDDPDPFTVDEARAAAGEMGNGVTLVSAVKLDAPGRTGVKAVYAFKDIRAVSLGLLNEPAGLELMDKADTLLTFALTRSSNGHSLLTIDNTIATTMAESWVPEPAAGKTPAEDAADDKMFDMVVPMLAGMKIDFAIEVGHLVKTNIPSVNGGRVTLLSVDFDQVLADPASIETLRTGYSPAGDGQWLQKMKGIKISFEPKLTIDFLR